MSSEEPEQRELNTIYWRGLFVPIVISMLVIAALLVFVTTGVGEPHTLVKKVKFGGLPNAAAAAANSA